MTDIKLQIISTLSSSISLVTEDISSKVKDLTSKVSTELNGYIQQNADQLSEKATTEINNGSWYKSTAEVLAGLFLMRL